VTVVRDIMDPAAPTVRPDTPVEQVVHAMKAHEVSGIAVVNEGGRCVGIITDDDLVLSGDDADLHLPYYVELFGGLVFLESLKHFEGRLNKAVAARAEDLMTEDPVTVEADAPVSEAARLIARKKHNRLPVVEHGRFVGIVTRVDVLDALTAD
jgi:CBS domain-containing protein